MSAGGTARAKVYGVLTVRDEVDLLRICIVYHLETACDKILVVDNGSTDGTRTALKRLAAKLPVVWTSDDGPYNQAAIINGLIGEAEAQGAEWVLPLDADEFWLGAADMRQVLAAQPPGVGALRAERIDFIQRRGERRSRPSSVLTMTRRHPDPRPGDEMVERFSRGDASVFELQTPSKLALRVVPGLRVGRGSHGAEGIAGETVEGGQAAIFHAQLRSRQALDLKAEGGRRALAGGSKPGESWHLRRFVDADERGELDAVWRASSYGDDGALDVGGRKVELVEDLRLREILEPWVRSPLANRIARLTGRTF